MTSDINRRLFLRGSVAAASAVAAVGLASGAVNAAPMAPKPAYGPKPGIAKLNSNENPYGPSAAAVEAMYEASKLGAYYVNDSVGMLLDMIGERHSLTRDQLALSSGSSGVLTYAAMAVAGKGKILGPDLFWDTTARAPQRQGAPELKRTAKTEDMGIDLDAMYDAIDDDVAMVQVTNPNNPTGMLVDADKLREFCKKASQKTIVLVDEAYNELTDMPDENSMVPLINEGYNVMVARTFSKIYGMAGMRVGYMMGTEELISMVNNYSLGNYAMNQAGVAGAVASYNDYEFLDFSKAKVSEAREMVYAALKENGLTGLPSVTNFIYVDLGDLNAEIFRQKMAEQNVHIRGIYQDYNNWSRVSMGMIEDVQKYIDALPKALDATAAT